MNSASDYVSTLLDKITEASSVTVTMKRSNRKKGKLVDLSEMTENKHVSSIALQCSAAGASLDRKSLELILHLEPKDDRSASEVISDFVNGMILCTDVCVESMHSNTEGNCGLCGKECEQRETVVRFTVKAERTTCQCDIKHVEDCSNSINGTSDSFKPDLVQDCETRIDANTSSLFGKEDGVDVHRYENTGNNDPTPVGVAEQLSEKSNCENALVNTYPLSSMLLSVESDSIKYPMQEGVDEECPQDIISTIPDTSVTNRDLKIAAAAEAETSEDKPCEICGPNAQCLCTFHCEICNVECDDLSELQLHLKLHETKDDNICTLCDCRFKRKMDLRKHLNSVHANEKAYKCDTCCKTFRDIYALKLHSRVHSGVRPYQCDVCGRTYTNSSGLRSHGRCHTGVKKFKCDKCDKAFYLSTELKSHAAVHTGERPFSCNLCSLNFMTKHHLAKHMKTHGERKHQCNMCPKAFITAKDLETHITTHTGDKKFKCKVCGSAFTAKASLKNHLLLHLQVKPYKCDVCQKEYASDIQLRKHSRLHNPANPFVCELCGKSFAINHYLQSHMKTHTGYEKFKCDICNKTYRDAPYLKIHMKTHTGEGMIKCEQCGENFADPTYLTVHKKKYCKSQKFHCGECGREFASRRDLSFHVGVHTGKCPYECAVCGKGFAKSETLASHAKQHDDSRKKHECEVCNKRFLCISDLRKHKRCHETKKVGSDLPDQYGIQIPASDLIPTESSIIEPECPSAMLSEVLQRSSIISGKLSDTSIDISETPDVTSSVTLLSDNPELDLSDIPVIALTSEEQAETLYLPDEPSSLVKSESSEMLLDTASISSPIHIDTLDPNTSLENALSFVMSDPDQLLSNPYVMYKLVLPGRSPSK